MYTLVIWMTMFGSTFGTGWTALAGPFETKQLCEQAVVSLTAGDPDNRSATSPSRYRCLKLKETK